MKQKRLKPKPRPGMALREALLAKPKPPNAARAAKLRIIAEYMAKKYGDANDYAG